MKQRVCSHSEILARIFAAVFMITIVIYFRSWVKRRNDTILPKVLLKIGQATFFCRKGLR